MLTWVTLLSFNLVITVSVIVRRIRNCLFGEEIGTAKLLRIHKAALIYKITVDAVLEWK